MTTETSKRLREQRGRHVTSMRAILDSAARDSRELTAEERASYEAHEKEQDRIAAQLEQAEKLERVEQEIAARDARSREVLTEVAGLEPAGMPAGQGGDGPELLGELFNAYRANGGKFTSEHQAKHYRAGEDYRRAYSRWLGRGVMPRGRFEAALQQDSDIAGGFLVAPLALTADLIKSIDDEVFVRRISTVRTVTNAQGLGTPTLEADPADADWTAEIGTGSEDSTMSFGRREWQPHPLAKRIKVSNKLLRSDAAGAESLVRQRLAYKFGVSEEKAFLSGTGASQPLGIFTAHASGVTTARDVSTGNSTTAIGADNLFEVKYSLKAGYQARGTWIFHRDAVKAIRKLKDSQNQYLWQAGLSAGEPDRILDRPFFMSEYAPNTFTTGLYVGIFGDFSYYWIADALGFQVQRLVELYAETNQTGFIGRLECDGMPVLAEAFARVKLA